MDAHQRETSQTPEAMEDIQRASYSSIGHKTREGDDTIAKGPVYIVHLEVRLKTHSTARADLIKELVHKHVSADQQLYIPGEISGWQSEPRLAQNVHRIMACETCKSFLDLSSVYVICARKDAFTDSMLTLLSSMSDQFDRCRQSGPRNTRLSTYRG